MVLHDGVPHRGNHPFRERLAELERLVPALRIVTHYSGSGRTGTGTGRMTAADVAEGLIARRARFYLCGPGPMLDALTEGLPGRGVPAFEIFSERFRPAPRAAAIPAGARHTVRFARSGRELTWTGPEGSLLELAERAGDALPNGCRVGQCESCACRVLEGEVAHLVAASEDLAEAAALTCQYVPLSDLVLDA